MTEKLTLEERLQVLEILHEETVWGLFLDNPEARRAIAQALYTRLEAAERHGSYPPHVLHALYQRADALSELDNTPDALRPAIRPFVQPSDEGQGEP